MVTVETFLLEKENGADREKDGEIATENAYLRAIEKEAKKEKGAEVVREKTKKEIGIKRTEKIERRWLSVLCWGQCRSG